MRTFENSGGAFSHFFSKLSLVKLIKCGQSVVISQNNVFKKAE